jgi:hypothetical protein
MDSAALWMREDAGCATAETAPPGGLIGLDAALPAEPASKKATGDRAAEATAPAGDNEPVARALEQIAELLAGQAANPFRCAAYREAARVVRTLARPVGELLAAEGLRGLERLPKIGRSLARTIEQLADSGTTPLLQRLRGSSDPERLLATVPGVGRRLATRIHERLGAETLADLEAAAWDGRLASVPGLGVRRVRGIRESIAGMLRRPRGAVTSSPAADEPPVSELLSIDYEYRRKAAGNRLVCVAPYRFNPTRAAWLPILHTERADRHYTALYSNTARAHLMGTTRDWVVVYRDDPAGHGQWTVITARLGPLHGRRIVRGREGECASHYAMEAGRAATECGRQLL